MRIFLYANIGAVRVCRGGVGSAIFDTAADGRFRSRFEVLKQRHGVWRVGRLLHDAGRRRLCRAKELGCRVKIQLSGCSAGADRVGTNKEGIYAGSYRQVDKGVMLMMGWELKLRKKLGSQVNILRRIGL